MPIKLFKYGLCACDCTCKKLKHSFKWIAVDFESQITPFGAITIYCANTYLWTF